MGSCQFITWLFTDLFDAYVLVNCFVVGSRPCSGGFSPGTPVFPSPAKSNTSKLLFDLDCSEELLNV